MWTDPYRQLSYLGVTATFVDLNLHSRKFRLLYCRSFPIELTTLKKKGAAPNPKRFRT